MWMVTHKILRYVLYGTYRTIPGRFPGYYPTRRLSELCATFTSVPGTSLRGRWHPSVPWFLGFRSLQYLDVLSEQKNTSLT